MFYVKQTCMTQLIINSCLIRIIKANDHLKKVRDNHNFVFCNEKCPVNYVNDKAYIQLIFSKSYTELLNRYIDTQDVNEILDDLNRYELICCDHNAEYSLSSITPLLLMKILQASEEECIICSSIVVEEGVLGCNFCSTLVCERCICKIFRCPCCKKIYYEVNKNKVKE